MLLIETDYTQLIIEQMVRAISILTDFARTIAKYQQHISNILKEGELEQNSVVKDYLRTASDGKEYSQYKIIQTRVSNELKEYYKKQYPYKLKYINNYDTDTLISSNIKKKIPTNNPNKYKGQLYLLTDNATYSAGATFAGLFKEMKLGKIIGEETGGTIEYYGDFFSCRLPNSGLTFYISPKRFVQYGGENLNKGVIPDFFCSNVENDILQFTFNLIEKQ